MPIWLIQLIVGIVFTVASTLLKQASDTTPQQGGVRSTYSTGGTVPVSFVVGTLGLPGKLEYENTWGNAGQTPNAYLTQVFSLSDVSCAALIGLFADSERQTIGTTGHVVQGFPVTGSRGGNLWVEFYSGSQITGSSFLLSKFGGDADRPWLSDMIGRGVAYVTLTALYDRTIWSGMPSYMLELQGIKLYDPRKDSAAGGSGTQRRATPSTWAFSENPAVIVYNILIGILDVNGDWLWGMQDTVSPSRLPYAIWAAAMNACDASISLVAGGTEKQFRVGREIKCDEKAVDVITELLVACNGRISEAAGIYTIVIGAPGAAVGSFTDADVIITESSTLEPFPALDQIVNGATASYLEPTQAWESKEAVPYYRADLETEDDGRRQAESLNLQSVYSGTQAQRILQAVVLDSRRFYRHAITLPPVFGLYQPLDVLSFTSTKNGYSDKDFLISTTEEGPNGNVVVGLQEVDSSDHDWTPGTDEQPYTFAPLTPVRPPTQVLSGWAVSPAVFLDNDGVARRPGISVTYDGGQADVRAVRITVREEVSGNIEFDSEIPYGAPFGGILPHAFLPATDYQARGDYTPYSARSHTPSSWLDVTTDDIKLDSVDIAALAITLAKLEQDIQNIVGPVFDSLQAKLLDHDEILGDLAQVVADNSASHQKQITGLAVKHDAVAAGVVLTQEAIITANTAMASLTEQVAAVQDNVAAEVERTATAQSSNTQAIASLHQTIIANFNANQAAISEVADTIAGVAGSIATLSDTVTANYNSLSAGGIMEWVASAGTNGASSRVSLLITATDGVTQVVAGLYYEITGTPGHWTSRTVSLADEHYWSDGSTGLAIPMSYVAGVLTVDQLAVRKVISPDGTTMVIDSTIPEITFIGP